jgi:hypothetical protein
MRCSYGVESAIERYAAGGTLRDVGRQNLHCGDPKPGPTIAEISPCLALRPSRAPREARTQQFGPG